MLFSLAQIQPSCGSCFKRLFDWYIYTINGKESSMPLIFRDYEDSGNDAPTNMTEHSSFMKHEYTFRKLIFFPCSRVVQAAPYKVVVVPATGNDIDVHLRNQDLSWKAFISSVDHLPG